MQMIQTLSQAPPDLNLRFQLNLLFHCIIVRTWVVKP